MPRYERFDDGEPCWVELASSDPVSAVDFSSALLGEGLGLVDAAHGGTA